MENASNALLIAGGVLVGVLILSLAVYLFVDFGTISADVRTQKEVQQLSEFNSQFTVYEGRTDLTIYDIVTIAGYALENNEYYENDNNYKINVFIKSGGHTTDILQNITNNYNGLIMDDQNNESPTYTLSSNNIVFNSSGRVQALTFTKN